MKEQAVSYGGTDLPGFERHNDKAFELHRSDDPKRKFINVFVGSLFVFLFQVLLFTFSPFFHLRAALLTLVIFVGISVSLAVDYRKSAHFLPMSICTLAAALCGAGTGAILYDQFGYFSILYNYTRIYDNVVPSQKAATVTDAGRIVFSVGSRVDTHYAAGVVAKDGNEYCAAPVRSSQTNMHVEFWAVGKNCCSNLGFFKCDSTEVKEARAGVIEFDSGGIWRRGRSDMYDAARQKAEATFGLDSPAAPIYVRWVTIKELDFLSSNYYSKALGFAILAFFLYGGLSFGFVWVLCNSLL
mmetsp:Transcript_30551/g.59932  ORF Transcript_30551/g.59932 Transcript_30551/m.59932 type:complete len:299 (+) Transcript_30551:105-1001(+)